MNFEAKPGIGIGGIRLGMMPKSVMQMMGPPDDQSVEHDELQLDYYSSKTSFFFGNDGSNRLNLIESNNPKLLVCGREIIGTSIANLAERLGFDSLHEETIEYDDGECFHYFPGISCFSEMSTVRSIQITLLFDEEDNELWPSLVD